MQRAPVSRRERPAKKALSRLATALDTGAASLYVDVKDTEELHATMLEELLGSLDLRRGRTSWRARLVEHLVSYGRAARGLTSCSSSRPPPRPSTPPATSLLTRMPMTRRWRTPRPGNINLDIAGLTCQRDA